MALHGAGATVVYFQGMFDAAVAEGASPIGLLKDGVHPTVAGHKLMAACWAKTAGVASAVRAPER